MSGPNKWSNQWEFLCVKSNFFSSPWSFLFPQGLEYSYFNEKNWNQMIQLSISFYIALDIIKDSCTSQNFDALRSNTCIWKGEQWNLTKLLFPFVQSQSCRWYCMKTNCCIAMHPNSCVDVNSTKVLKLPWVIICVPSTRGQHW